MMGRLFWLFVTFFVAAAVHISYVLYAPTLAMQRALSRIAGDNGSNHFFVMAPEAQTGLLQAATREDIVGLCLLNLSKGKIMISAEVPNSLWTLSIYNQSGSQVYEIDDAAAGTNMFNIELTRAKSLLQQLSIKPESEEAGQIENIGWHAELNDQRGIAVLWIPVSDPLRRAALVDSIKGTRCEEKKP